ncbi:MAG: ATP-dependent DNA helicase RecQ [Rikenellaceae bacterium]
MKKVQKPLPTPEQALYSYWGYSEFRPMQREIIDSVLAGNDTLALLPTGGGKSLTYQIPALVSRGVCVVVTPLIALMKDQVDRLRHLGVPAVAIHSGLSRRQIDVALDNCVYGDVKMLYVAPERLTSQLFMERLRRMDVSLFAIDEAHCISQWGYDFRPSYLKIGLVRGMHPNVPMLALTASATELVCKDIMLNLRFTNDRIIRGSFTRKNLSYAIRRTDDKDGQLLRILSKVDGAAIVYVRTRKGCEQIAQYLNSHGCPAIFYHGGLPHTERSLRQDEWIRSEYRVIVATNAFGMGIDKADVRVVVHYTICDSLEAYYQESGRAGRDGARSYAVLLEASNDVARVEKSLESEFPSLQMVKEIYDKICRKLEIAYGEGSDICYNFDMRKFCRDESIYQGTFMSAVKILQMNSYLTLIDEMEQTARIMFIVNRDDLYRVRVIHQNLDHFIRTLLRLYDGVFTEFRAIDERRICEVSGYKLLQVRDMLKQLWRMRLIRYTPTNYSAMIYLPKDRLSVEDIFISPESYKYRKEIYEERLSRMVEYSKNETICRSQILCRHFGEEDAPECGVCDVCIERRRSSVNNDKSEQQSGELRRVILSTIGVENQPSISVRELLSSMPYPSGAILAELDLLSRQGAVEVDAAGYLHLK